MKTASKLVVHPPLSHALERVLRDFQRALIASSGIAPQQQGQAHARRKFGRAAKPSVRVVVRGFELLTGPVEDLFARNAARRQELGVLLERAHQFGGLFGDSGAVFPVVVRYRLQHPWESPAARGGLLEESTSPP